MIQAYSGDPPGDTRKAAAVVMDYLTAHGVDARLAAGREELPNVVAVVKGENPGRRLVLNGHLDTFPVVDSHLWNVDPLGGEIVDGRIYGRGASDMKAGIALSMAVAVALNRMSNKLTGQFVFTAVGDEVGQGPWGADYLLDNVEEARGDAVLAAEPTSCDIMRFGERGSIFMEIETTGRSAHSAYAYQGSSAINTMMGVLAELQQLEVLPVDMPAEVLTEVEAARDRADAIWGKGATDALKRIGVNVGTLAGGTRLNMVPDQCRAGLSLRLPPGVPADGILESIKAIARNGGATVNIIQASGPTYSSPDHDIVRAVRGAAKEIRGSTPSLYIGLGANDTRLFRRRGIPAFTYGPTPNNASMPNEYVTIQDVVDVAKVYAIAAYDYLTA
ncbi:MAG: ArgE/DapE family deacylase [Chloroflexi bacterium]|nr:ArgE/DapE family deacylase [Chloroflexota bacterium]